MSEKRIRAVLLPTGKYVSIADYASVNKISRHTVHWRIRHGKMPNAYRVGDGYVVNISEKV